MEQNESDSIAQVDESLQFIPSNDEEERYWKMRSIYRVPARVYHDRNAYWPQVVSFGPYHQGEDHLLPMEEHKHRALSHFIKRSRKPDELFFESLSQVAWDLKESYDALDQKWKDSRLLGQFVELMITDGCFMLEILRFASEEVGDYAPNDPIFSNHGKLYIMPYIVQDMLMLENQLPMLLLDRLVAVESDGEKDDDYVKGLILKVCPPRTHNTTLGKCLHVLDVFRKSMVMEPEKKDKEQDDELVNRLTLTFWSRSPIKRMGNFLHVLDVLRESILRRPKNKDKKEGHSDRWIILSATELREHGIRFKNSKTESLRDISFVSGVLRLPVFVVDHATESLFLNLMAFERFHVGAGNEVMSYIFLMDYIIDNGRDVALLRAQGIILNRLESDEVAAKMFNSLAKVVTLDPDCSLIDVLYKVNEYCNKHWNTWRANFIHTYLRNPWVIMSLVAAVFLFALTIIQTVYTVLGYHK